MGALVPEAPRDVHGPQVAAAPRFPGAIMNSTFFRAEETHRPTGGRASPKVTVFRLPLGEAPGSRAVDGVAPYDRNGRRDGPSARSSPGVRRDAGAARPGKLPVRTAPRTARPAL